jgi:hypothetical protein
MVISLVSKRTSYHERWCRHCKLCSWWRYWWSSLVKKR